VTGYRCAFLATKRRVDNPSLRNSELSCANAGEKDLLLNLGIMTRNGEQQYLTAVSLIIVDAQESPAYLNSRASYGLAMLEGKRLLCRFRLVRPSPPLWTWTTTGLRRLRFLHTEARHLFARCHSIVCCFRKSICAAIRKPTFVVEMVNAGPTKSNSLQFEFQTDSSGGRPPRNPISKSREFLVLYTWTISRITDIKLLPVPILSYRK